MAPQASFSCSVCDDEFISVSTLHYHQMCLHTTEELSLAILSIRELTVNTSPVAENPASPSTDCEDKLLRNGLAKYPRFLNSGGSRKSKVDKPENNGSVTDNKSDVQKNLSTDKENAPKDVPGKGDSDDKVEVKVENDECAEGGEPVRSSLWGAIKTLDGKAVDAPVIKIDKKRKSNRLPKVAVINTGSLGSADNSKEPVDEISTVSSLCHDLDSTMGKEKILEKQLKLMNMSSFDDCIELDCSDDSDEDGETFITDVSDDEEKNSECKETGSGVQDEGIKSNFSDKSNESLYVNSSCIKSKRLRGKIQKHRTWYKGGSFQASNLKAPNSSISISKDLGKNVEGNKVTTMESHGYYSEEMDKNILMGSDSQDCPKVLIDSCVQTDNFFFEEVSNSVVKMLEANNGQVVDSARHSYKKATPKKHLNIEKNSKNKVIKPEAVFKKASVPSMPSSVKPSFSKSEVVVLGEEKRFFCKDCGKTYKKRSHLERHKRVHTGERPFICPYCDKGFSVRSILNQHIRIHTGEKPYSCTICAARFPQKSGLMTHMMLHTGKPFKCDQCDKAFVSNHKLVHHLKSHDGDRPHVCDVCTSAFFTAGALEDHKTLHSRNRKHLCNKCNASFVHEVYLKIHLATHLLEADCENAIGDIDVGSVSPAGSTSSQSNAEPRNELTLTLDAIDQFCNGETIMMDLSG